MMHNVIGYYVVATRDDSTRWYMAIGRASGEYEYFTTDAASAALFLSLEMAEYKVDKCMGDVFLHNASGANRDRPVRTVRIATEVVTSVEEGTAKDYTFRIIRGLTPMTVLDANGREVPHVRCACGRHRQAVDATCCRPCGSGQHTSACNIRQEAFADTRRGAYVAEGAGVPRAQSPDATPRLREQGTGVCLGEEQANAMNTRITLTYPSPCGCGPAEYTLRGVRVLEASLCPVGECFIPEHVDAEHRARIAAYVRLLNAERL